MTTESKFAMSKLDAALAATEKDEQEAEDAANDVKEAIVLIMAAQKKLAAMSKEKRRIFLSYVGPTLKEAESCLAQNRLHQNPAVRQRVWKALIGHYIGTQQIASKDDAKLIVSRLVSDGFLIEKPEGTLAILGKSYIVSPESGFEADDLVETERQWTGFKNRVQEAIKDSASLTLEGLLGGEEGVINMFVPPQKYFLNREPAWRPGGLLIVESDRLWIRLLGVIGGKTIVNMVNQAISLDAKVTVRALQWTNPPTVKYKPGDAIGKERNAKTQAFWYMLKRGIKFAEWQEKTEAKADLDAKGFFLEGRCGKHYLDYGEPWQDTIKPDKPDEVLWISRPTFLIERLEKDSKNHIQILEVPEHLVDWLTNCRGCYLEGVNFEGLPQPLRKLLQKMAEETVRAEAKTVAAAEKLVEAVLTPESPSCSLVESK